MSKSARSAVLTSANGAYQCTPNHAVALAYAMNLAEGCLASPKVDRFDVAETLLSYLDGRETIEETISSLREIAGVDDEGPATASATSSEARL